MRWLGLTEDAGPYYQTQRFPRYKEVIAQMLAAGTAYRCYCTKEELDELRAAQMARKDKPRYDGRWRDRTDSRPGVDPVIRFKNPLDGDVVVDDKIHGPVHFSNTELDDLIIARSDGTPTYNFCVVVDDMDMGVTHVIRGDDHLNNTPRQINMLRALGVKPPVYAHVSMILGPDGAKLSKRHGAVSVLEYEKQGYLPEALLNFLVRLGWSHGDQEVFTREEMIELFDIDRVGKSASAFNPDKLLWLNQQHIMRADPGLLAGELAKFLARIGIETQDHAKLVGVVIAMRERSKTLVEMAANSRFFFLDQIEIDPAAAVKHLPAEARAVLQELAQHLAAVADWKKAPLHESLSAFAASKGLALGKVAQPLRVALCGGTASPPIDVTLEVLGRESSLARIAAVKSSP
jgi:glutamyl-tRNA synthetase